MSLERAVEVIRLKQEADANRLIQDFGVDNIQVLNGRYGPYITDKIKNARIPKERDPKSMTLQECRELLAAAPARGNRFGRGRRGAAGKAAGEARGSHRPARRRRPRVQTARAPRPANPRRQRSKAARKEKEERPRRAGVRRAATPKVEA